MPVTGKPLATIDLNGILTGDQLPALPQSALRLLELSQGPDNGPPEFAVPIESDPGLASQVLRFVNSSYFGFSHEISTVRLALTLVGVRTIKSFILWSAVFSSIPDPKCGPFDLKQAWQDSLRRALFARAVARVLGVKEAEQPFSAALLQDVALPLLASAAPQVYAKLLEERGRAALRLSDMERRTFGWTHAEAGGMVCRQWNLPEQLATLVENHLEIDRCVSAAEDGPGAAAVALSALLPSAVDAGWTERELFERWYERTVSSSGPEMADLFGDIDRQYSKLAPVLKLPLPSQGLTDLYEGLAAAPQDDGLPHHRDGVPATV